MLLACVVRECDGTWGIDQADTAIEGTRIWANLPYTGAHSYVHRRY